MRSQQAMGQRRPGDLSPLAKPGSGQMAIVINLRPYRLVRSRTVLGRDAAAHVFIDRARLPSSVEALERRGSRLDLTAASLLIPDRPTAEDVSCASASSRSCRRPGGCYAPANLSLDRAGAAAAIRVHAVMPTATAPTMENSVCQVSEGTACFAIPWTAW